MEPIRQGRHVARLAAGADDLAQVRRLRWDAFYRARGLAAGPGEDSDRFDALCRHVLIETDGRLAGCFRFLALPSGAAAGQSYSAQFYDLAPLAALSAPVAEMGRFCLRPGLSDPDVLRLAWGALARLVDGLGTRLLFGCASLPGADPTRHRAALAALGSGYMGPEGLRPGARAAETVPLPKTAGGGLAAVPPLLRSYLALGGWVSDHAVIDRALDTLHVFTALDTADLPAGRARALRRIAGGQG